MFHSQCVKHRRSFCKWIWGVAKYTVRKDKWIFVPYRRYYSTCQDVYGSLSRVGWWRRLVSNRFCSAAVCEYSNIINISWLKLIAGKDAKRGILLDEECQVDIESAFLRETVAKKYASLFHSTLHHNTGYFLQVFFFIYLFHAELYTASCNATRFWILIILIVVFVMSLFDFLWLYDLIWHLEF